MRASCNAPGSDQTWIACVGTLVRLAGVNSCPEVRIDGEPYWDGGIYSNMPIEAVLDDSPRRDSLIFAVNIWHQSAPEPESIWQVIGGARQKQINRLHHVIR